ncbi:MAG TPA: alpha/beta hydrolase [Gaiellaceae bacterium]|nr:alpha/beta hydrolase [Gaiellaceae bacterium]
MSGAGAQIEIRSREAGGWELREAAGLPADAPAALLLPGGLCSAVFYDDVVACAARLKSPVRVVAVTPPGFVGRPAPADPTVESFAGLASGLAAELGCRAVAGHSYGANIAIEMAAGGRFAGPLVLASPSFSRRDEFRALAVIDRLGTVPGLGTLLWKRVPRVSARALRASLAREELVDEIRRNDGLVCRRLVREYFRSLDRGGLAERLRDAGVRAWIVFGDHDEVGLTAAEREVLTGTDPITLEVVPGATHFVITEQPERIAGLIAQAVAGA